MPGTSGAQPASPATGVKGREPLFQPGRFSKLVVLMLIGIVPPVAITGFAFGAGATSAAIFGALVPLVNMLKSGTRVSVSASFAVILMAPIAIASGINPLAGAALMGATCLIVGTSAGWGLQSGLSMVPLAVGYLLISPPVINGQSVDRSSLPYMLGVTAIMAISAVIPVLGVQLLMRGKHLPSAPRNNLVDTVEYAVIISVLSAAATFVLLEWQLGPDSFWLLLTLLVVVQVGPQATIKKTFDRTWGTVLGAAVAAVLVMLIPSTTVLMLLGLVSMLLTLNFIGTSRYWLYAACLTPTIVLTSGASNMEITAEQRVLYTLIGAALALVAFAISFAVRRIMKGSHGHSTA